MKYNVWFTKSIHVSVEIEANSEKEAEEKACKKLYSLTEEERHKDETICYQTSGYELSYTEEVK